VRRPRLEVADVFHRHGADWRRANAGHVSLGQLQVMSAIEQCRSAALGGHVERCEDCGHSRIAYNSCLMGSNWLWGADEGTVRTKQRSGAHLLPIIIWL
jgi:hypothetical protein